MDYNRAQEIYASPKEYEVSYNGVSVWIDKLHDDGKTATVIYDVPSKNVLK